jgi:hypothetical protein
VRVPDQQRYLRLRYLPVALTEVHRTCDASERCDIANEFEGQMKMRDVGLNVYSGCRDVPGRAEIFKGREGMIGNVQLTATGADQTVLRDSVL